MSKIGFCPHKNQVHILDNLRRYTAITAGRRFGKTLVASYLAMKYLCLPNKTIWVVAPTYDLAKRTWKYIYGWVLREFPNMKINQSTLSITCEETGSTLELKTAENPASCIGAGVDLLIVDEASRIKGVVWEEALFPTLSDKKGSAFFISTPKGKNWFYEIFLKGQENYEEYISFSFETKDNDSLPHLAEEQEKAKKTLPQAVYEQEYLARFLDGQGQVFKGIKDCMNGKLEEPVLGKSYVMGVDLAKYEDYTAITIMDMTSFNVVYFERFNQIDWEFQRQKIKAISKRYFDCPIVIDSTGVGNPIAESLVREGHRVIAYKYTNASKKFLIENLALKIQRREISYPYIKELINELEIFGYEFTQSGNIIYSAPQGYHDDCVNSLALAVHGLGHYQRDIEAIKAPYPEGSMGFYEQQLKLKEEEKELEYFI